MIGKGKSKYPHGISTFSVLKGDVLSPPFESYVKDDGTVKISSLGRAIYGLDLDELSDYSFTTEVVDEIEATPYFSTDRDYQVMSSTSDTGREISIHVSLSLPFSDDIACSRFTDLPQQPRWSDRHCAASGVAGCDWGESPLPGFARRCRRGSLHSEVGRDADHCDGNPIA